MPLTLRRTCRGSSASTSRENSLSCRSRWRSLGYAHSLDSLPSTLPRQKHMLAATLLCIAMLTSLGKDPKAVYLTCAYCTAFSINDRRSTARLWLRWRRRKATRRCWRSPMTDPRGGRRTMSSRSCTPRRRSRATYFATPSPTRGLWTRSASSWARPTSSIQCQLRSVPGLMRPSTRASRVTCAPRRR